jgi:hypothetical protein
LMLVTFEGGTGPTWARETTWETTQEMDAGTDVRTFGR